MGPIEFDMTLPPFRLESGAHLATHRLHGWAWAPADDEAALRILRDGGTATLRAAVPTVLLVHALTGDARAGGDGGWWEPLIGPGRALDPERMRILCFNNLGSCYGSTGPDDGDFPTRGDEAAMPSPLPNGRGHFELSGELPATVTSWDQAHSIRIALEALGIEELALVAGGSLGGMIALCLDRLLPGRIRTLLPIAAAERASPWIIAWNHVARQTLLAHGLDGPAARRGLELARQLAMITYRAEDGFEQRHGRAMVHALSWHSRAPYAVQTYLEHQGHKLAARYTPASYYVQLGAMDHHDVARESPHHPVHAGGPVPREAQRVVSVGIRTDALYLPHHARDVAEAAAANGRPAAYHELDSPHGHDAFLIEWDMLEPIVRAALEPADGAASAPTEPRSE